MNLIFKIASEEWEFKQIHILNYKTFVEEIPQHPRNPSRILVDKFHNENTYLICIHADQVVGMIAVRHKRPFSLDGKIQNIEAYLPPHRSVCEFRLLLVAKEQRGTRVFRGLMLLLASYCESLGYDLAIISGTLRQLKLYENFGFVPFGPIVGSKECQFQPMYFTLQAYKELKRKSRAFVL